MDSEFQQSIVDEVKRSEGTGVRGLTRGLATFPQVSRYLGAFISQRQGRKTPKRTPGGALLLCIFKCRNLTAICYTLPLPQPETPDIPSKCNHCENNHPTPKRVNCKENHPLSDIIRLTQLTHSYLLNKEHALNHDHCRSPLTV